MLVILIYDQRIDFNLHRLMDRISYIKMGFFLHLLHGKWDVSSQPGTEPVPPAFEVGILNQWTARKVPRK